MNEIPLEDLWVHEILGRAKPGFNIPRLSYTCTRCGETKSESKFKEGSPPLCKLCAKALDKKRQSARMAQKKFRRENPDYYRVKKL